MILHSSFTAGELWLSLSRCKHTRYCFTSALVGLEQLSIVIVIRIVS